MDGRTERSSLGMLPLLLGPMLVTGCTRPRCQETYSPLVKLLVGLPIPMYVTMGLAAAVMVGISGLLRRSRRLPRGGLAAVAATCAALPVFGLLASHEAMIVVALAVWAMLLALVVILALHKPGPDAKEQSWLLCLSGVTRPSPADRILAGWLAVVLLFVTLVGSLVTLASVSEAGKRCEWPDKRPSPTSAAESKSN